MEMMTNLHCNLIKLNDILLLELKKNEKSARNCIIPLPTYVNRNGNVFNRNFCFPISL